VSANNDFYTHSSYSNININYMFLAYKIFSYFFFWRSNNIISYNRAKLSVDVTVTNNLSRILTLSMRIISRTARTANIEYLTGIGQLFERSLEGGDASTLVKGRNEDSFNDTVLCNASFFVRRHARHEN